MKNVSAFALIVSVLTTQSAMADTSRYSHPFDIMYSLHSAGQTGTNTMHEMCDGKGHLRTETDFGTDKVTEIIDFPNKLVTTIDSHAKSYMKTPLTQAQEDAHEYKQPAGAKSLGAKVIDKHPCHGWSEQRGGNTVTYWIGDDIHTLVQSETASNGGTAVVSLKSFATTVPAGDLLAIPPGLTETKVPGKK